MKRTLVIGPHSLRSLYMGILLDSYILRTKNYVFKATHDAVLHIDDL